MTEVDLCKLRDALDKPTLQEAIDTVEKFINDYMFKLAEDSPTRTFTIHADPIAQVYDNIANLNGRKDG